MNGHVLHANDHFAASRCLGLSSSRSQCGRASTIQERPSALPRVAQSRNARRSRMLGFVVIPDAPGQPGNRFRWRKVSARERSRLRPNFAQPGEWPLRIQQGARSPSLYAERTREFGGTISQDDDPRSFRSVSLIPASLATKLIGKARQNTLNPCVHVKSVAQYRIAARVVTPPPRGTCRAHHPPSRARRALSDLSRQAFFRAAMRNQAPSAGLRARTIMVASYAPIWDAAGSRNQHNR